MKELLDAADAYTTGLAELLNDAQVWVRRNVMADAVICSFINRSFEIYRAVRTLANNDLGHDAQVLARSALEILIECHYITNQSVETRASRFAQFEARQVIENINDFIKHGALVQRSDWDRLQKIAAQFPSSMYWEYRDIIKNGVSKRIPVKLKEMVTEHEHLDPELGSIEWAYDIAYSLASSYVHPRPLGLRAHFPELVAPYQVTEVAQGKLAESAVVLTTYSIGLIVNRALIYWGLNAEAEKCNELYKTKYEQALMDAGRRGAILPGPRERVPRK